MELMRQQAVNFGTRIVTDDVVEVDLQAPAVCACARAKARRTKRTRSSSPPAREPNYLGLPSEEAFKNRGVSACAVCDGALPRFRNKPLVVVGGGDSAVEEATYLTKFASKVHMVHRRDKLRASKIMQERALDESEDRNGVESRRSTKCLGNDKDGVTGVRLESTGGDGRRELPASGVFLAIGHTPNTAFLEGPVSSSTTRATSSGRTPFRTYTSVEGVFAAGDVADDYYARRSPPPAPAAWRRSMPNAGWRRREFIDASRLTRHGGQWKRSALAAERPAIGISAARLDSHAARFARAASAFWN